MVTKVIGTGLAINHPTRDWPWTEKGRAIHHEDVSWLLMRARLGSQDFCRGDRLANVPLRVVRDVDQQASDGCWQTILSDRAWFIEIGTR